MIDEAKSAGIKAEGCDIAPCKPWITQATLPILPYADGQFDVVGCFDVLEHLPESDAPAACAELIRVCKKLLIVSVASCSDPRMVDGVEVELHLTRRPVEWWQGQFKRASTIVPTPGQPEWRSYLSMDVKP
jgi:ubiquinone/menaquinone biosynthesis C-methylase UbiE